MGDNQSSDVDKVCEAIRTIAGTTGPGLRDTRNKLSEVSKKIDELTGSIDHAAILVSEETGNLTKAIKQEAEGNKIVAKRMLTTNVLLVVATFFLVVVSIFQLLN